MAGANKIILITLLTLALLISGAVYFVYNFLSALKPAKITITKTEIRSSRGFINPITIEKIKIDSIGENQRPVKYTINYVTTCAIKQQSNRPPVALNKINLNKSGRYSWSEEDVSISVVHDDGLSQRESSFQGITWSNESKSYNICPIKFDKKNWYFINFQDPQIVGIYIYIDNAGELHQYTTYTGVSPI